MVKARLSSKGQLTIPVEIRRRYDLKTGDEVQFVAEEKGAYLVPLKRRSLMDLYGVMKAPGPWPGKGRAREMAGRMLADELRRKSRRER